ncbi:MAG: ThiF family adenylyltransferase [Planctomycetes bacterium]|nr:ThiF family adenylyltransferase [Planctomycetota bacterium]
MSKLDFSDEYTEQFSRHLRLPKFGRAAQEKIAAAKIFIAGAGGLGSAAVTYLATIGLKKIGLIDNDTVEISNLPRQIIHDPAKVGELKVDSAAQRIKQLNPKMELGIYKERLKANNILGIIKKYDLVIDGTDNFASKYLLNDAGVIANVPLIHAGVLRFSGQVLTIQPKESACYRCIFKEPPSPGTVPDCSEAGILNTVAGIIGLVQATEAIKLITGLGELLTNRLLVFDALSMKFRNIEIRRDPHCPVCGQKPTIKTVADLKIVECQD